jgi:hypothetical protein
MSRPLPTINEVDLYIKAVVDEEDRTGKKIDMESISPNQLHRLCVNYLRHRWFYPLNSPDVRPTEYLELSQRFTNQIEKQYPHLAEAAREQYVAKIRKVSGIDIHELDRELNQLINDFGYKFLIQWWKWHGCPGPLSDRSPVPPALDKAVFIKISGASDDECARSSSEYVRQCKLWIDRHAEWLADWLVLEKVNITLER